MSKSYPIDVAARTDDLHPVRANPDPQARICALGRMRCPTDQEALDRGAEQPLRLVAILCMDRKRAHDSA